MGSIWHLVNFRGSFVRLSPGESCVTISLLSCLGWLLLDNGTSFFFFFLSNSLKKCNDWISKNIHLLSTVWYSLPGCWEKKNTIRKRQGHYWKQTHVFPPLKVCRDACYLSAFQIVTVYMHLSRDNVWMISAQRQTVKWIRQDVKKLI